jgi:hypothetical protein
MTKRKMMEVSDLPKAKVGASLARVELLRRAAEAGPGYRGSRRALDGAELEDLVAGFHAARLTPPDYLSTAYRWVDRRAKLFEAGEYADKGLTVTEDHLRGLEQNFDLPVPVLIEHSDSPLQLGYLTDVRARGGELFGTVALTQEAHDLIEQSGARSLSLGLASDLSQICEVSLVRSPRVPGAQLFAGSVRMVGELERAQETDDGPPCEPNEASHDGEGDGPLGFGEASYRERYDALRMEFDQMVAESQIHAYLRSGKLVPAQAPYAMALLKSSGVVTFDGESRTVPQLVRALLDRQPQLSLFAQLTPDTVEDNGQASLLPDEVEFYRRHFPGVSLTEIAERKRR